MLQHVSTLDDKRWELFAVLRLFERYATAAMAETTVKGGLQTS